MIKNSFKTLREQERHREIQEFVMICSSFLSLPLYLCFWFADLLYAPNYKWEFLALRSIMIPVCLLVNFSIKRTTTHPQAQIIALLFTFANSFIITIMVFLAEGAMSPYYAGLNLVAAGVMTCIPWSVPFLLTAIVGIYGPFYIGSLLYFDTLYDPSLFGVHSFFNMSTLIIAMVIRYFTEKLREKELNSRMELNNEISSREKIIQEKTAEALKLGMLTKQFSPQVVHAIKHGQLNILKSVHRAHICAIFIDIVNSTDRVIRIDKDDVNKVISMFIDDAMKTLLKYDITIDKFLGDGILAFSNDPIPYDDYVERVLDAALEIRSRIHARKDEYLEYWLNEFQVRIGISIGYANVGFYGGDEYFKSYTAIGRVINLASRICGAAQPNQILIDSDTARVLAESTYQLDSAGQFKLKGFEADIFKLHAVMDGSKLNYSDSDIELCPQGHGVLHLDTDESGIYVLKCRTCHYILADLHQTLRHVA